MIMGCEFMLVLSGILWVNRVSFVEIFIEFKVTVFSTFLDEEKKSFTA